MYVKFKVLFERSKKYIEYRKIKLDWNGMIKFGLNCLQ